MSSDKKNKKRGRFPRPSQGTWTGQPLRRRLTRFIFLLAGAVLLGIFYGNSTVSREFESALLDLQLLLRSPRQFDEMVVVRISDADYENIFDRHSPLEPSQLQKLLAAIVAGRPRAIGVDLDTSSKRFQSLELPADSPPVVWARGAEYSNIRNRYVLAEVLGGKIPAPVSGLVAFRTDPDGVIRRYVRWHQTDLGPIPGLPFLLLEQSRGTPISVPPSQTQLDDERFIGYMGAASIATLVSPPASQILDMAKSEGWSTSGLLKGKIVLLAGDYAAQDEHRTPVGWMTGAEILATVLETEKEGGGAKPIQRWTVVILGVCEGVALILITHLLGLRRTFLVCLVVVPLLAVGGSYVHGGSATYAGYFIAILLAVLLQQLYEEGKKRIARITEKAAGELKDKDRQ